MADAVTTNVVLNSPNQYIVCLTCVSDGTGETNVTKIIKANLLASNGAAPTSLDLQSARWCVQGYSSVRLAWDHTTDDTMTVLSGSGYDDYSHPGPGIVGFTDAGARNDPRSAGGPGDVLLTSVGASATATYDITLTFKKTP